VFNFSFIYKFCKAANVGNKEQAVVIHGHSFCKVTSGKKSKIDSTRVRVLNLALSSGATTRV
ncbi:MAG: hypothetical protein ABIO81_10805, partial [Ginsengibacter sp.]